jgi:hypothetical protein
VIQVVALEVDPVGLGSEDGAYVCYCDDGAEYVLKDQSIIPLLPHIEWFCYRLCEYVGVAHPAYRTVLDFNNNVVFGSRWEASAPFSKSCRELIKDGTIPRPEASKCLSRIFAMDCFLYNEDRNGRNYILRQQHSTWLLMPIDYSRSWMVHGWPVPLPPFMIIQKTLQARRTLNKMLGYDIFSSTNAIGVLKRLHDVTANHIEAIISSHPDEWLDKRQKDVIVQWWASPARTARIENVIQGITDGSYL